MLQFWSWLFLFVVHIESETVFAESLEKLGNYAMSYEQDSPEVGRFVFL